MNDDDAPTACAPSPGQPLAPAGRRARLILVDDHRVLAQGLRTLLQPTHDVVAVAHSGDDLLPILHTRPADCLLLDLMLPGQNGLALLPAIRGIQPALKIVILTMLVHRPLAEACLRAGANGFVPKDADIGEILDAITTVLAGDRYLSPRIPNVTHAVGLTAEQQSFEQLTPRQQQVVLLLGRGKRPAQIAEALGLSRSTVTFHLQKAEEKLGLPADTLLQWAVLMADQSPPPQVGSMGSSRRPRGERRLSRRRPEMPRAA